MMEANGSKELKAAPQTSSELRGYYPNYGLIQTKRTILRTSVNINYQPYL